MAHFVIESESNDVTVKAWDEDSIEIRPATVREALTAEYGDPELDDNYAGGYRTGTKVPRWRAIDHIVDIVNTYRTGDKDVMLVNGAVANDTHGYDDYVSVANYRVLADTDNWGGTEAWIDSTYINADYAGLYLDEPAPADLIDVIEGLMNYPVIDEDEACQVEQELIQEHWESYGKYDAIGIVADTLGFVRDGLTDAAAEIIERLTFGGIVDGKYGDCYPEWQDASSVDFHSEDIAAWIKERYNTVVDVHRWGSHYEQFDLTHDNLIESEI